METLEEERARRIHVQQQRDKYLEENAALKEKLSERDGSIVRLENELARYVRSAPH